MSQLELAQEDARIVLLASVAVSLAWTAEEVLVVVPGPWRGLFYF